MKTLITIFATTAFISSSSAGSMAKHRVTDRPAAADFFANSPVPSRDTRANDACIGLNSGTADASCGATLTGGPSGGLD